MTFSRNSLKQNFLTEFFGLKWKLSYTFAKNRLQLKTGQWKATTPNVHNDRDLATG